MGTTTMMHTHPCHLPSMPHKTTGNSAHGFTLIELMIVVAIIAIIAAITLPSWHRAVLKSDRSDAQVALNQDAQVLERCYTQFGTYKSPPCPALATSSPQNYYSVAAVATSSTFSITASASGSQQGDTGCTTMSLDNTGTKNPATCWEK